MKPSEDTLEEAPFSPRENRLAARIRELEARVDSLATRNDRMMQHYAQMWTNQIGSFSGRWTSFSERQVAVEFVERWSEASGVSRMRLLGWLEISESKFFSWKRQVLQSAAVQESLSEESSVDEAVPEDMLEAAAQ